MPNEQNVNTPGYWNYRFVSGDWEDKGGFSQTRAFAESQLAHFGLPRDFSGTLCDFGCGAGDAFPVYRAAYPNARLVGVDFSPRAIELCAGKYPAMAEFTVGDYSSVPCCNVVIASNVLEHLDDDEVAVSHLLAKCRRLFVVVPYRENPLCSEHVRTYSCDSFSRFPVVRKVVFASRGWSEYGLRQHLFSIEVKNMFRKILGQPLHCRKMQIMFELAGSLCE